jgi:FkbM family methyltransferase
MRRLIGRLKWAWRMLRAASDARSFERLVRLYLTQPPNNVLEVRLRELDGHPVSIRAGTSDLWSLEGLEPPVHLPPLELQRDRIRLIWDLGANIGLTMVHLAIECPNAQITGVEMDPANAALCRRNIAATGSRCELIEAAVWDSDGYVDYQPHPVGLEVGFHIVGDEQHSGLRAKTIRLNQLLDNQPPDTIVDYVKMDIEGAEARVLESNTEWASRVRSIKIEVHPPYTVAECRRQLERLGFRTAIDANYDPESTRMPPVIGIRDPLELPPALA